MFVILSRGHILFFSHLNQHIKKEKQDGGDISPFAVAGSEVENMLEVSEVSVS